MNGVSHMIPFVVTGGLLIALALARQRPELRVLVIERGERFGEAAIELNFITDTDLQQAAFDVFTAIRYPNIFT